FDWTWVQETIDWSGFISSPGIESSEILIDCLGALAPAFWVGCFMYVGVPQNHDFRIVCGLRVIGHRTIKFVFQVRYFFVTFEQRGNHNVAAVGDREVMRIGVTCCNPD